MNTKYFGETLEGTGQAEDYRLKLSLRRANNTNIVNKKPVNEFMKTHLLAFAGIMSQALPTISQVLIIKISIT